MDRTGHPVPTTLHQQARAKVGDGKSVKVSVPAGSGPIAAGTLQYFGGYLGFAVQSLENDAVNAQELILTIEEAEFETDQILADGEPDQAFEPGTDIFWDEAEGHLTETPTPIYAGKVTVARDANDVIWFLLARQLPRESNAAVLAGQIGDLGDLDTGEPHDTIVSAMNELIARIEELETGE